MSDTEDNGVTACATGASPALRAPSPCPYCGHQPDIGLCEPWPKSAGHQPWYAVCYKLGFGEHSVGANGDTREGAIKNWEREVRLNQPRGLSAGGSADAEMPSTPKATPAQEQRE